MKAHFVSYERAGGIATVQLVQARPLNILTSDAIEELTAALGELAGDDGVRAVVLRGSGDKAFIGGADINEMARLDRAAAEAFIRRLAGLCEAIRHRSSPGWPDGAWGPVSRWRCRVTCGWPEPGRGSACPRSRWESRRSSTPRCCRR
jgi:Enoyl-CoA hydratase/isomerase